MARGRKPRKKCKNCRRILDEDEEEIFGNQCHECYNKYLDDMSDELEVVF